MAIYFDKVYNLTKCIRGNSTGAFFIIKYTSFTFRENKTKEEAIRSVQISEKKPSESFIPLVLLYYYISKNAKVKFYYKVKRQQAHDSTTTILSDQGILVVQSHSQLCNQLRYLRNICHFKSIKQGPKVQKSTEIIHINLNIYI